MKNKKLEDLFINGEFGTVSRDILEPDNRAKIKKYDEKRKNFIDLKDHQNGFISPNGVFYPCSWASHETLREYLSWILEIDFNGKSVKLMDSIQKFESLFVKLSHTDEYVNISPPLMFMGKFLTPHQKLTIEAWANIHWKGLYILENKGFYRINSEYIIDSDCKIRKEKL